ncbi:hypothetical protein ABVT39_006367 [Epinephelus coioides]
MQKRLLTDTIKNIYMKFQSESTHQVSYSFFCSQRPFRVVALTDADRETCQSKTHENLQFMSNSLFNSGLLSTKEAKKIADTIVCDPNLKNCVYGVCGECSITAVQLVRPTTADSIAVTQWSTEVNKDDEKKSTVTVKKEVMLTEDEAVEQFQNRMAKFHDHIFNICWQYRAYRELREKLADNKYLIHIDFSENYLRKHDPLAIWAHLDPMLNMVKEKFPKVQRLHFFSDGLATQYKQKGNVFLLSTKPFKRGFDISWNFFEASHGKGAPDGIGGTLKRLANRLGRRHPKHTSAVPKAQSSVQLFFVTERSVEEMLEVPPLTAIKGTMKIHQIMSTSLGKGQREIITSGHVGRWCVVRYDDDPYPGIIMAVEENNIQVNCMHRNGVNKFFWPGPRKDVSWYADSQHAASKEHLTCEALWRDKERRIHTSKEISTLINTDQLQRNRYYLSAIIDVVEFLAVNQLPFRGNHDAYSDINEDGCGLFLSLFEFALRKDAELAKIAKTIPRNATYTSHDIQNNLIDVMIALVREHIVKEVGESFYTLKADGTRDPTGRENISIVLRFVNELCELVQPEVV